MFQKECPATDTSRYSMSWYTRPTSLFSSTMSGRWKFLITTTTDDVAATGNSDAHLSTLWSVVTAFVHLLSVVPDADLP